MKLLISELPKSPWWGTGMPHYANNWAMKAGAIPDQHLVLQEHTQLLATLKKIGEVVMFPFPPQFDRDQENRHDVVFVRDSFISNTKGKAVLANFSEREREPEVAVAKTFLESLGATLYSLSENAYAEGGEFYFAARDQMLFAGVCRNNEKGIEEVAKYLEAKSLCIVQTAAFHLDTIFTTMLDKTGHLVGVITCPSQIKNWPQVKDYLDTHTLTFLEIQIHDTIGLPDNLGSGAANCLSLPGVLVGGHRFETPGIEEKIAELGITHMTTPTTQFNLSGGSVHCLTNELW